MTMDQQTIAAKPAGREAPSPVRDDRIVAPLPGATVRVSGTNLISSNLDRKSGNLPEVVIAGNENGPEEVQRPGTTARLTRLASELRLYQGCPGAFEILRVRERNDA